MKQIGNMHHSITIEFVKIEKNQLFNVIFHICSCLRFLKFPSYRKKEKVGNNCSTALGEQILPYQWSSDIGDNGVTNEKFVVA